MKIATLLTCLILVVLVTKISGNLKKISVPRVLRGCYDRAGRSKNRIAATIRSEAIDKYCLRQYTFRNRRRLNNNLGAAPSRGAKEVLGLLNQYEGTQMRGKRAVGNRIRKDYRHLTNEERAKYHRAILMLKADTTVQPNRYNAIADIHTGDIANTAHGGPQFLPWHRYYILMYEEALRSKVPDVVLPYWDSTLDAQLENPVDSAIWSDEFMGKGIGIVDSGPFRNWNTTAAGLLVRNIGTSGLLMTKQYIEDMFTKTTLEEISSPTADFDFDLEFAHGDVHNWIGGHFSMLETAAYDPMFFMHHAFIDCLWEEWRENQRANGVDPTSDYPVDVEFPFQELDAPLGFGNITIRQALSDVLTTNVYRCAPRPTCSRAKPSCDSPYLVCNRTTWSCVPLEIPVECPNRVVKRPYQNTYCVGNECDSQQWAYLPAQIVFNRRPDSRNLGTFRIVNGKPNRAADLYSPADYSSLPKQQFTQVQRLPPAYCRKDTCCGGAGAVWIESTGLNYQGTYREYTLVDSRLAISSAIGFVAVKRPQRGSPTKVVVRAYDSCGRICQAACLVPNSNQYQPCEGAIKIDNRNSDRFYGLDYGEAVGTVWDYGVDPNCPQYSQNKMFLTFYCDFNGVNPLLFRDNATVMAPPPAPPPAPRAPSNTRRPKPRKPNKRRKPKKPKGYKGNSGRFSMIVF